MQGLYISYLQNVKFGKILNLKIIVVNVNQLQMVYECSYAPAFISNVLQIPYGGYLNTTFNNAPVQIVNYASEGFWQIGIGNN